MKNDPIRELQDWRELFEAFAVLPLPPAVRPRALWPNQWHKDCAAVALALHQREDEIYRYTKEKDKIEQIEILKYTLNFLRLPLGIDPTISNLDTEKLLTAFTAALKQRGLLPKDA